MELVDPNVGGSWHDKQQQQPQSQQQPPPQREGWGTAEATEMITNNLFYITVKVSDVTSLLPAQLALAVWRRASQRSGGVVGRPVRLLAAKPEDRRALPLHRLRHGARRAHRIRERE